MTPDFIGTHSIARPFRSHRAQWTNGDTHALTALDAVILDEVHSIADEGTGPTWEHILQVSSVRHRATSPGLSDDVCVSRKWPVLQH